MLTLYGILLWRCTHGKKEIQGPQGRKKGLPV